MTSIGKSYPKLSATNGKTIIQQNIQILTNWSEKACYRLMQKIGAKSGKESKIPLIIHEFSDYMRIRPDIVDAMLKKKQSIR